MGNGEGRLSGCGRGNRFGDGAGSGYGRVGGSHKTNAPKVRLEPTEIRGLVPFDVVTRVVSRNLGLVRRCYEQGLAKSPSLEGRVSVRFVIDRDGSVSNVRNGGSDLQDRDVISWVLRPYYGLSFPETKNGIVTDVYPLEFVCT